MTQVILSIIGILITVLGVLAQLYPTEIRTWFNDPPAEERPLPECTCPVAHVPSAAGKRSAEPFVSPLETVPGTSIDVIPPPAATQTESTPTIVTELDVPPIKGGRGRTFNLDDMYRKRSTTSITLEDQ